MRTRSSSHTLARAVKSPGLSLRQKQKKVRIRCHTVCGSYFSFVMAPARLLTRKAAHTLVGVTHSGSQWKSTCKSFVTPIAYSANHNLTSERKSFLSITVHTPLPQATYRPGSNTRLVRLHQRIRVTRTFQLRRSYKSGVPARI